MRDRPRGPSIPWGRIYAHWDLVVCDLQQVYGVTWHLSLSWPWPVVRGYVEGLFTVPTSRVHAAFIAPLIGGDHN